MAAEILLCPACGVRNKETRKKCVRCGAPFVTAPASVPAAPPRPGALWRPRGGIAIGAAAGSLVLLAFAAVRGGDAPPRNAGAAGTGRSTSAPAPEKRPTVHDPGFVDPKQGGNAAYAAGDYATAVAQYRQAAERNPNDADALNNLGQTLVRIGKPAEALPHFQRAVSLYPSVWAYRFNLAKAHAEMRNWRQAVDDYRHARTLFPDDYVTTFNLGMALHKMGDEEAAVVEFRKGAELAPGEASFHLSLGISYEQLNRPGDAASAYERYLSLSPGAADADKVKARIEHLRKPA